MKKIRCMNETATCVCRHSSNDHLTYGGRPTKCNAGIGDGIVLPCDCTVYQPSEGDDDASTKCVPEMGAHLEDCEHVTADDAGEHECAWEDHVAAGADYDVTIDQCQICHKIRLSRFGSSEWEYSVPESRATDAEAALAEVTETAGILSDQYEEAVEGRYQNGRDKRAAEAKVAAVEAVIERMNDPRKGLLASELASLGTGGAEVSTRYWQRQVKAAIADTGDAPIGDAESP